MLFFLLILVDLVVSRMDNSCLIDLAIVHVADCCEALFFIAVLTMVIDHLLSVRLTSTHVGHSLLRLRYCLNNGVIVIVSL